MTKKIITSYSAFLCMAIVMVGVSTAHASEVTGTLSSDTSNSAPTSGSISGSVTSGSNGGSGGGGSRSNGNNGGSSSNSPSGSVLGAQDSNTQSPGFPNAGTLTEVSSTDQSLWSSMKAFFGNIFSF